MSGCDSFLALTTPTNLLIFGMKVGDNELRKLTGPDFSVKSILVFMGIQGKIWPKNGDFSTFLENQTYKFADLLMVGEQ